MTERGPCAGRLRDRARVSSRRLWTAACLLAPNRAKTVSKCAVGMNGNIGRVAPSAVGNESAIVRCIPMKCTIVRTVALNTSFRTPSFAILVIPRRRVSVHASVATPSSASGLSGTTLVGALPRADAVRRRSSARFTQRGCPTPNFELFKAMLLSRISGSRPGLRRQCSSLSAVV